MPSVSCRIAEIMQRTYQLVVKTGTSLTGELMVLLQGGVTLFQGRGVLHPTGWLDKLLQLSDRNRHAPIKYKTIKIEYSQYSQ